MADRLSLNNLAGGGAGGREGIDCGGKWFLKCEGGVGDATPLGLGGDGMGRGKGGNGEWCFDAKGGGGRGI